MAVICRDLGLLFLCVPKTGSSAIAELLIRDFGGEWLPGEDIHNDDGSLRCGMKHSTVSDLLKVNLITTEEREKFIVAATTRHPVDWLVSQYFYSRQVYEKEGEQTDLSWVQRHLDLYRHAATHSFEEHVSAYWLRPGASVSARWAKAADVLLRYETLQLDFDRLLLGMGVSAPPLIAEFNQTERKPYTIDEAIVSSDVRSSIVGGYGQDFVRFGYSPQASAPERSEVGSLRMLVIDDLVPAERLGFGYPRALAILQHLAQRDCAITLFPTIDQSRREPEYSELRALGVTVVHGDEGAAISLGDLSGTPFDIVLISRYRNLVGYLKACRSLWPDAVVAYDAECLAGAREASRASVLGSPDTREATLAQEMSLIANCDLVISVSAKEQVLIQSHCEKDVSILSHAAARAVTSAGFADRDGALFVGRFAGREFGVTFPNEDAYDFLCQDIAPLLKDVDPSLAVSVAGRGSDLLSPCAVGNVHVLGEVRDLSQLFEKARVFIAPTRFSAGVPLKVLDAMAYGVPVVMSAHLAEQLGGASAEAAVVVRDAAEFVEAVVDLNRSEDRWAALRERALAFVEELAGPDVFGRQIEEILHKITALCGAKHT